MKIVSLLGNPAAWSRSVWLAERMNRRMKAEGGHLLHTIALRELPAAMLVHGAPVRGEGAQALRLVAEADAVLVSTPVCRGSFSGLLKAFIDLLPDDWLEGKTVLPLASGGQAAHGPSIDAALKPLLYGLGAHRVLDTVHALDAQLEPHATHGYLAEQAVLRRMDVALRSLLDLGVAAQRRPASSRPASARAWTRSSGTAVASQSLARSSGPM